MLFYLLSSLSATLILCGIYRLFKIVYDEVTSPLRDLPGPEYASIINGNMKELGADRKFLRHNEPMIVEKWVARYGPTIAYSKYFGVKELYTMDTKALSHVLLNSYDYHKTKEMRYELTQLYGPGLLVAEDEKHRQQRSTLNTAFCATRVHELVETFMETSIDLRNAWIAEIARQGGIGRLDALSGLGKMTLDSTGLTCFGYTLSDLGDSTSIGTFSTTLASISQNTEMGMLSKLKAWFPPLRIMHEGRTPQLKYVHKIMTLLGHAMWRDGRYRVLRGNSMWGRNLQSVLIKAHMGIDIYDNQPMSYQDVLAQVRTFMIAGYDTTSIGLAWAFFALAQNPKIQSKLRSELLMIASAKPTTEELNALPYLDLFIHETLRLYAPVPTTDRVAMKDDVLPLSTPFTDRKGNIQHSIRIKKGQTIAIPILAMNRSKSIWGEDALEFRPERWKSVPEAAKSIPGVWGNMLTFLGGPRSCIGFRFSLVEMKYFIFTLVRAFEFELAVPIEDIGKKTTLVQWPAVMADSESQMPLLIKLYNHS